MPAVTLEARGDPICISASIRVCQGLAAGAGPRAPPCGTAVSTRGTAYDTQVARPPHNCEAEEGSSPMPQEQEH